MTEAEAIENIDIGGPTMIRAAAKNHRSVVVVVQPESYDAVLAELEESGGERLGARRASGSRTRRSPSPPATTRRSAAGSASGTRNSPSTG